MPDEIVEVAQEDREAADQYVKANADAVIGPKRFDDEFMQNVLYSAFARHRLAATDDLKASNAALVEALRSLTEAAESCAEFMNTTIMDDAITKADAALQAYADGEKV